VLGRERSRDTTVVVTHVSRIDASSREGLLWSSSARRDCYVLHPATIVADAVGD